MMKVKLLVSAVLTGLIFNALFTCSAIAGDSQSGTAKKVADDDWTMFQVGVLANYPAYIVKSNVYGMKLGLPLSGGEGSVSGVEFSLFGSSTYNVYGLQFATLASAAKYVEGFQFAALTCISKKLDGFQLSVVNVIKDLYGVQLGAYNVVTNDANGAQIGAFNVAGAADGTQVGVINIATKCGFQVGLINVIEDGWLPFCILFNYSF